MMIKTMVSRQLKPHQVFDLMPEDTKCAHVWGINQDTNGILWHQAKTHMLVSSELAMEQVGDGDFRIESIKYIRAFSSECHPGEVALPDAVDMSLVRHRDILQHYLRLTYPDFNIKVLGMELVSMQFILQTTDRLELRRYDLIDGRLEIIGMPLAYWLL
jgi:hypothetical protein